jgi:hypothetical protein
LHQAQIMSNITMCCDRGKVSAYCFYLMIHNLWFSCSWNKYWKIDDHRRMKFLWWLN